MNWGEDCLWQSARKPSDGNWLPIAKFRARRRWVAKCLFIIRTFFSWLFSGDWPSGKASGSGPVIGGSNPSSPASIEFN